MHSDWLKLVTWLATPNKNAIFLFEIGSRLKGFGANGEEPNFCFIFQHEWQIKNNLFLLEISRLYLDETMKQLKKSNWLKWMMYDQQLFVPFILVHFVPS